MKITKAAQIKEGQRSGFHACCIRWYFVRLWIKDVTGVWINLKPKTKAQHILCPAHVLSSWLGLFKLRYHKCGTCRNVRLARSWNKKCNYCAGCKHVFRKNAANCSKCGFNRNPLYGALCCGEGHRATDWKWFYD